MFIERPGETLLQVNIRSEFNALFGGYNMKFKDAYNDVEPRFQKEIIPKLEDAGYTVSVVNELFSPECHTPIEHMIVTSKKSDMRLCMNTMEALGYASKQELDDIIAIINTCGDVNAEVIHVSQFGG